MAKELLELIENIKAEEATSGKIFAKEGVGAHQVKQMADYKIKLAEAARIYSRAITGSRRDFLNFSEAMTTSDFPLLFGDILDRQMLANYKETPSVYRNYCKISTVADFRTVKRFTTSGAEGILAAVEEQAEYPESELDEAKFQYAVKKYGRAIPISWETMINDDLDALKDVPARFGRAARRSEQKFATGLHVGTSGPDATLYSTANKNIVTSNPVLSIAGLQTAMTIIAAQVDTGGDPIFIDAIHLVVPPALEITAKNILNATQLVLNTAGATTTQELRVNNWMQNRVKLSVDPYIPIVASSSNTNTSWYLFADPNDGRPALEVGFLRGHTTPEIRIKSPNSMMVGGGNVNAMDGDFDTDSIRYRIRHVFGGVTLDPKMTVASNGSGS